MMAEDETATYQNLRQALMESSPLRSIVISVAFSRRLETASSHLSPVPMRH